MPATDRLRVLNAEPEGYSPAARSILESVAVVVDGPFSREELREELARSDALIVRFGHRVDDDLLSASSTLRAVSSATTGLDHIDVEAAGRRGVTILSLQGEREFLSTVRATSEHTWALLLTLLRRTHRAHAHVESGGWARDGFRGHELSGRRLGIVGFGRIGQHVCAYGQAFGMDVMAYDPNVLRWPEDQAHAPSLPAMLRRTDVLTLHVPLNGETLRMIGESELSLLPRGACLVNTSRGAIIDEDALVAALESGHLGGAALDVLADEDRLLDGGGPGRRLLEYAAAHDNLVVTPHIGGATHESMEKTEVFMAKKLVEWLMDPAHSGRSLSPGGDPL